MTESSQPATAPASAESPILDPEGWYEDEDYAIRTQLGLRPTFYRKSPDPFPCPPWCEASQEGCDHDVNVARPFGARHESRRIEVALSLYDGDSAVSEEGRGVQTGHLEVYLSSTGTGRPAIQMGRWYAPGGKGQYVRRLLGLSLRDATEVVTVLTYLLAQAEASEVLAGRAGVTDVEMKS